MARTRLLAFILCACFALGGAGGLAYADEAAGAPLAPGASIAAESAAASSWVGLQAKVNDAKPGEVIELSDNVAAMASQSRIEVRKSVTIDLAGHELNRGRTSEDKDGHVIEVFEGATLTVQDSSASKAGTIVGGFSTRGGGIYVHEGATLVVEGGTITRNKARVAGGGIYVAGTLKMTGGAVKANNSNDIGGGIYVTPTGSIDLSGADVSSNAAKNEGGGLYLNLSKNSAISSCQITNNNSVGEYGGGIYMDAKDRKLTIADTKIDENVSWDDGAGIYLYRGAIEMTGGSLSENRTNNDGGGAKVTSKTTFKADGVTIDKNTAATEEGGGVKNQGTTTLRNCIVSNNTSKKPGGGIFNDNDGDSEGDLTVENCAIFLNSSGTKGGGVYSDKKLAIKSATIAQNKSAEGRGNGVFIGKDSDPTDLEGTIVVKDNEPSLGGQDVFLRTGQKLNLSGPLAEGTSIGVTAEDASGAFTTRYRANNPGTDPATLFFSPEGMKVGLDASGEAIFDFKRWKREYEFDFGNSKKNFNTGKYTMLDSDFQKLCDYLDKMGRSWKKNTLAEKREREWKGSCYGMAMSTLLDYTGQISFKENFDPGKKTMHDVSSPKSNRKVMSAVNYYHLSQYIGDVAYEDTLVYSNLYSSWREGLEKLVRTAQANKMALFSYFWDKKGKSCGHAIVLKGYDGTDSDGNHVLIAYDNRYPNKNTEVVVSKNFDKCVVAGKDDAYSIEITTDFSAWDRIDIDGPGNDMVIDASGGDVRPQADPGTEIYVPADGDIRIENQAGETLQVSDGIVDESGSTMKVRAEHMIVNSTEEEDVPGTLAIAVEDSGSFAFSSDSSSIEATVSGKGYYGDVTAENAESVTISEGGTSLRGDDVSYTVTQSVESDVCDMVSVSGTTKGDADVSYSDGKVKVTGNSGEEVTILEFLNGNTFELYAGAVGMDEVEFELRDPCKVQHAFMHVDRVEPTCEEDGNVEFWYCMNCNRAYTDSEDPQTETPLKDTVLEALGHKWGDWEVVAEPTATSEGLERRRCENDNGHVEERAVPAKGKAPSMVALNDRTADYTGKAIGIGTATVTGSKGAVTYSYYSDAACAKKLAGAPVNAGTYYAKATVAADEAHEGATSEAAKLTIVKVANTMKAKAKDGLAASAKKKTAFAKSKAFAVSGAQGKVAFKKTKGNSKVKVASSGKVTVKKGLKKGKTYKVKVKVTAAGNTNYDAGSETVTLKIAVK